MNKCDVCKAVANEIYNCCEEKQIFNCGFCVEFPCEKIDDEQKLNITKLMLKQKEVQSYCGLICNTCDFKEQFNCGGCIKTQGNPFHGKCPISSCCIGKGYHHCGECENMPCEQLYTYSYLDVEHGDTPPGARLNVLRYWVKNQ